MTTNFENGVAGAAGRTAAAHTQFNVNDTVLEFGRLYYTMLSTEPERMHFFYGKQSSLLHCMEGETDVTVCQGLEDIHQRISAMQYNGVRVVIKNIDCQSSLQGSILIFVIGTMHWPSGVERRFTQSFVLAQQTNGYYVMNDIMRMADVEAAPSAPAPAAQPEVQPAPVAQTPVKAAPAEPRTPAKAAPAPAAPAPAPVAEKKPEPAPAQASAAPKAREEPKTPSSWAELAANRNTSWKSGVVAETKGPVASIPAPKAAPAAAPRQDARPAEPRRDQRAPEPRRDGRTGDQRREGRPAEGARDQRTSDAPRRGNAPAGDKRAERPAHGRPASYDASKSIFVSGLRAPFDESGVKAYFSACGAVKSCEILASKGFAFIEFESPAAQQAALKLASPSFAGASLNIEPRRTQRRSRDDAKA